MRRNAARARRVRMILDDHRARYLLAGSFIALLYLGLFAGLAYTAPQWHYVTWFCLAQVVTVTVAFPLYRTWVFRSGDSVRRDLGRFLSVWSASLVGSALGLPFLVEVVGLDPVVAQVVAVLVLSLASYLGHHLVSFRHRRDPEPTVESPA